MTFRQTFRIKKQMTSKWRRHDSNMRRQGSRLTYLTWVCKDDSILVREKRSNYLTGYARKEYYLEKKIGKTVGRLTNVMCLLCFIWDNLFAATILFLMFVSRLSVLVFRHSCEVFNESVINPDLKDWNNIHSECTLVIAFFFQHIVIKFRSFLNSIRLKS